jgi:transposase
VKQVTLIGAISETGYVYHKILNADGKKTTGVGADDFCLFLNSLGSGLCNDSIIIIDNAPIHRGEQFKEVVEQLEKSKGISIEFLPPYSPFLNPIEYLFHSIRTHVCSKAPQHQAALVAEVKTGIETVITPEKSKKFFDRCKKFYCSCLKMQPITGNILTSPL